MGPRPAARLGHRHDPSGSCAPRRVGEQHVRAGGLRHGRRAGPGGGRTRRGRRGRCWRGRGASTLVVLAAPIPLHECPEACHGAVVGRSRQVRGWRWRCRGRGPDDAELRSRVCRVKALAGDDATVEEQPDKRWEQQQAADHREAALLEPPAVVDGADLLVPGAAALAHERVAGRSVETAVALPNKVPIRAGHGALGLAAGHLHASASACAVTRAVPAGGDLGAGWRSHQGGHLASEDRVAHSGTAHCGAGRHRAVHRITGRVAGKVTRPRRHGIPREERGPWSHGLTKYGARLGVGRGKARSRDESHPQRPGALPNSARGDSVKQAQVP
mmetsp:Transcript_79563/g.251389  ORF Transcript_79563/g.251389 Transcript_79563/m.251389 type:complete len:330 (+) Transcript_79563:851-1840(+)